MTLCQKAMRGGRFNLRSHNEYWKLHRHKHKHTHTHTHTQREREREREREFTRTGAGTEMKGEGRDSGYNDLSRSLYRCTRQQNPSKSS
mmetsp:Transcript_14191/g.22619  ORF Transcript_14191/g.22619 Transcript_14191/m.22619 type:complete len:89 (-) Transcript_14191:883-1149(-)